MKEISWTDLKKIPLSELRNEPCLKVTGNGLVIFYAVMEPQGAMVAKVEGICGMIDASMGRT